jgi:hypothetical protein
MKNSILISGFVLLAHGVYAQGQPAATTATTPEGRGDFWDNLPIHYSENRGFLLGGDKDNAPFAFRLVKDFLKTGPTAKTANFSYAKDESTGNSTVTADAAAVLSTREFMVEDFKKTKVTFYGGYELDRSGSGAKRQDVGKAFGVARVTTDKDIVIGNKNLGNEFLLGPSYEIDRKNDTEAFKFIMEYQPWKADSGTDKAVEAEKNKTKVGQLAYKATDASGQTLGCLDWFAAPRVGLDFTSLEKDGSGQLKEVEQSARDIAKKALKDELDGEFLRASLDVQLTIYRRFTLSYDLTYRSPLEDLGDDRVYHEGSLAWALGKPDKDKDLSRPHVSLIGTYKQGRNSPDFAETDRWEIALGTRF